MRTYCNLYLEPESLHYQRQAAIKELRNKMNAEKHEAVKEIQVVLNSSMQNLTVNETDAYVPDANAPDNMQELIDVFQIIGYIIQPLILVVGVAGNILTLVTMMFSRFKDLTSRYIILFLALSDTALLLTQPLNKFWIIKLIGIDLRALSTLSCKIFFVIFRSAKMTSSWLVVLLCVERYVAVIFPLRAKSILRKHYIVMRQALKGNLSSATNSSMSANKKQITKTLKASVMVIGVLISYGSPGPHRIPTRGTCCARLSL
ncbi:growth hormone secretagogue receptor type 1-like [Dreissena polymorpha]|uniref:growth hormone secretagogue receptor type 1-like n=1 Tax=Dreissena polymorpha TaxID=45954 RepID=UPI0022651766|nr:growth hormone secretagogue receptor type 1-like [Dreissena polymorpha]